MTRFKALLIAAPIATALAAAPMAHADWHGHDRGRHGEWHGDHRGPGVGGLLLGLGAAAVVGGVIASQGYAPPPAYYAPPPVYYPPPAYYAPPPAYPGY
jgi:hypothetical protein